MHLLFPKSYECESVAVSILVTRSKGCTEELMRAVGTLAIGDHTFTQVCVDGSETGAARMSRRSNFKRV